VRWRPELLVSKDTFTFFSYADPVARGLLQAWKYGFDERAFQILKKEIEEKIPQLRMWIAAREAQVLVPVPLFYVRRNERGFDQAHALAELFGAMADVSCDSSVRRMASTKPQAQKPDAERAQSYIKNPFVAGDSFQGKRIVIVDDVITTGATIAAVTNAIQKSGGIYAGRLALFSAESN
jgi:ComF family protein